MSPGASLEQGKITDIFRMVMTMIVRIIVTGLLLRNATLLMKMKMINLNKMRNPRRVLTRSSSLSILRRTSQFLIQARR